MISWISNPPIWRIGLTVFPQADRAFMLKGCPGPEWPHDALETECIVPSTIQVKQRSVFLPRMQWRITSPRSFLHTLFSPQIKVIDFFPQVLSISRAAARFLPVAFMAGLVLCPLRPVFADEDVPKQPGEKAASSLPVLAHELNFRKLKNVASPEKSRIRGQLPAGWQDDSAWANLNVRYNVQKEGDERPFLRARVSQWSSGQAQIVLPLEFRPSQRVFYELEMVARSSTHSRLALLLRQRKAPYRSFWSRDLILTPAWQSFRIGFERDPHSGNPPEESLMLVLGRQATIDLRELTLRQWTEEDYLQHLRKTAPPAAKPPAVLLQSRFPLGLPTGWSLENAGSSSASGSHWSPAIPKDWPAAPQLQPALPPLRLIPPPQLRLVAGGDNQVVKVPASSPQRMMLYSAPFTVRRPFISHTASIYLCGEQGWGNLSVLCDGKEIAKMDLDDRSAKRWGRYELSFDPVPTGKDYVLRLIVNSSSQLVDGVLVNEGKKALDYPKADGPEIHARFISEEESALNYVFLADELPPLEIVAVNPDKNQRLNYRVVLPGLRIAMSGQLSFEKKSGISRVQLEVPAKSLGDYAGPVVAEFSFEGDDSSDRNNQAPHGQAVCFRLPKPRYFFEGSSQSSSFGFHLHESGLDLPAWAKVLGFNWIRPGYRSGALLQWADVEPEKGVWRLDRVRPLYYRSLDLNILGIFYTTPAWARSGKYREMNSFHDRLFQPRDLTDWQNYIRTVTTYYRGLIDYWEVWSNPAGWTLFSDYEENAPNYHQHYIMPDESAQNYAALLRAADSFARGLGDPAIKLVGLGGQAGAGSPGSLWFAEALMHADPDQTDYLSYQAVNSFKDISQIDPDDAYIRGIYESFLWPLHQARGEIPPGLWLTGGSVEGVHHDDTNPGALMRNADLAVRFYLAHRAAGAERIFFSGLEEGGFAGDGHDSGSIRLLDRSGQPTPAACALAVLASKVDGLSFYRRLEISPNLWALFFASSEKDQDRGPSRRPVAIVLPTDLLDGYKLGRVHGVTARGLMNETVDARWRTEKTLLYLEGPSNIRVLEDKVRRALPRVE